MKQYKTALIVVDAVNCLTRPGYGTTYYDEAGEMMPCLVKSVERMREKGVLIVFIASNDGYSHPKNTELSRGSGNAKYAHADPEAGELDSRLNYDKDRDLFVRKYTFSSFYKTDLANTLRVRGVENVMVCGIKTNVCCRQTTIDSASYGFNTYMLSDMVSTNTHEQTLFHLNEIGRYFARVIDSETALELLDKNEL